MHEDLIGGMYGMHIKKLNFLMIIGRFVMSGFLRVTATKLFSIIPDEVAKWAVKLDRRLIWAAKNPIDVVMHDYLSKYSMNINSKYWMETLAYCHRYEPHVTDIVRHLAGSGVDVALDVGANAGIIAILIADTIGTNGVVHCFEPSPVVFPRLKANVDLNLSLSGRIKLNNVGVGAENGKLEFFEFGHMLGNGCLTPPQTSGFDFTPSIHSTVDVITLDEYVAQNDIKKVGFIKVDTEGYEFNVLKGGLQTIKSCRPIMLLETLHRPELGINGRDNFIKISDFMKSLDYQSVEYVSNRKYRLVDEKSFPDETIFVPSEKVGLLGL